MLRNEWIRQIGIGLQLGLAVFWSTIGYAPHLFAQGTKYTYDQAPEWWKARDVIDPVSNESNLGVANLGQIKWVATQAKAELTAILGDLVNVDTALSLESSVGAVLDPSETGYDDWATGNVGPANLGQLKAVAKPFYDLVNEISAPWVGQQLSNYSVVATTATSTHATTAGGNYFEGGAYPWDPDTPVEDNFAPALTGQLKATFALAFRADVDQAGQGDQLPDLFEHALLHYNPGGQFTGVASIDDITWFPGDAVVSIDNGDGTFTKTSARAPFPDLASANASVASLLSEHEAVGAVGGTFSAGSDGSANYSIPIDLPAGTSGMAPQLSLSYSSHAGNGLVGVGFDIGGLQRITRGAATYHKDGFVDGVDFDENDRFFLDGERLVCVAGTYGTTGSEYRTEKDSFAKIFLKNDATLSHKLYWEIETKSGNTIFLGNCSTSCVPTVDGNNPLLWMVNRVQDRSGNYYEVIYGTDTESGEGFDYRPELIRYTGNDSASPTLAPYVEVDFQYESRPDSSFGFVAGTKTSNTRRLKCIAVSSFGSLNYSYDLSYLDDGDDAQGTSYRDPSTDELDAERYLADWQTLRSKLATITRTAPSGASLPPTVFTWQQPSGTSRWSSVQSGWSIPKLHDYPSKPDLGWRYVEANGDGLVDLLRSYDSNNDGTPENTELYRNQGDEFLPLSGYNVPLPLARADQKDPGTRLLDINGDGFLDLAKSVADGGVIVPGSPDSNEVWTITQRTTGSGSIIYCKFERGDGKQTNLKPFTSPTTSGNPALIYSTSPTESHYIWPISEDPSGPSVGDTYWETSEWYGNDPSSAVYLGTGGGSFEATASITDLPIAYIDDEYNDLGADNQDFNGDGLHDYAMLNGQTTGDNNKIFVLSPDGTSFLDSGYSLPADTSGVTYTRYPTEEDAEDGHRWLDFGDLNGDGEIDLFRAIYDNEGSNDELHLVSFLRNESGWVESPEYAIPAALYNTDDTATGVDLLDVNGDGLMDAVLARDVDTTEDVSGATPWQHIGTTFSKMRFQDTTDPNAPIVNLSKSLVPATFYHHTDGYYYYWTEVEGGFAENRVWLNTGKGWADTSSTGALSYSLPRTLRTDEASGSKDKGVEIADFNGDGLPDLLETSHDPDGPDDDEDPLDVNVVWINNGVGGWIRDESFRLPTDVRFFDSDTDRDNGRTKLDLVDLNGDGFLDLIDDTHTTTPRVFLNQCAPEVITEIEDGLGAVIKAQFAYGAETYLGSYGNSNNVFSDLGPCSTVYYEPALTAAGLQAPATLTSAVGGYLLAAYSEEDGTGSDRWRYRQYGPRKIDRTNEANLGFAWILEEDGQTGALSVINFTQEYPYEQMPSRERTVAPFAASHQLLTDTTHQYGYETTFATTDCGDVLHVYQASSTKITYHPGGGSTVLATTTTSYTDGTTTSNGSPGVHMDEWGNVEEMTVTTTGNSETLSVLTENVYGSSELYKRFGRLTSATTTTSWTGASVDKVKSSTFTYNGDLVLESECAEPGHALATTTTYGYDQFGNKVKTTTTPDSPTSAASDSPRSVGVAYDDYGRFVIDTILYDGTTPIITSTNTYNQQRALLVATTDTLNNLTSQFFYDEWGTRILTRTPDGLEAAEITKSGGAPTGASLDTNATEIAFIRKTQGSGAPAATAYIDSQGRVVLTCTESFDGTLVYQQTLYDSKGREYKKSLPYFAGTTPKWSETLFDNFERPWKILFPDSTNETSDFSVAYQVTQTNRDGKQRRTTLDVRGETVSVEDISPGTIVSYDDDWRTPDSDPTSLIRTTTAPGGHVITTKLDLFGNILSVNDPDTGEHTTTYNAFGETLSVTDAKNVTTSSVYDRFGRITEAQRPEGRIVYYYDDDGSAAPGASTRKLYKVEQYASDNTTVTYTETTAFDRLGRTLSVTTNRQGEITTTSTTYDELGRVKTETDAGGLTVQHVYDSRSFETELRDYYTGEVYYKPLTFDAAGRVLTEELGEGITTTNTWREETGALLTTSSVAGGTTFQDLEMDWDAVGNLQFREDHVRGFEETFGYDNAYRLTSTYFSTGGGSGTTSNYTYTADNTGNILTMPNVEDTTATYGYDATATHRLTSVTGTNLHREYVYNANGEITHEYEGSPTSNDIRRTYAWASFHKPTQIIHNHGYAYTLKDQDGNVVRPGGLVTMTFDYGPGDSRIKQHVVTDEEQKTTYYYGSYERLETYDVLTGGGLAFQDIKHRHSIGGVAMKEIIEDANGNRGPPEAKYYLRDHLGSVTATLTYDGATWTASSKSSYDAWGRPRQEATWEPADSGSWITNEETTRGFTGHEMLDDVGLVHMNGRIYDAEIGRFLTPDPFVQAPENAQNYNRYSYVLNNPVSYTDPSGYFFSAIGKFFKSIFKAIASVFSAVVKAIKRASRWVKENWRVVVSIAFAVFATYVFVGLPGLTGGNFLIANNIASVAAAGATIGAFNAAISGGGLEDILKGALVGGVTAALTAGVLQKLDNYLYEVVGHGIVGGARNELMGGKFADGFWGAAAGQAFPSFQPWDGPIGRTVGAAIVGGTAAAIGGGDFANGAFSAAFMHLVVEGTITEKQRLIDQEQAKFFYPDEDPNLSSHWEGHGINGSSRDQHYQDWANERGVAVFHIYSEGGFSGAVQDILEVAIDRLLFGFGSKVTREFVRGYEQLPAHARLVGDTHSQGTAHVISAKFLRPDLFPESVLYARSPAVYQPRIFLADLYSGSHTIWEMPIGDIANLYASLNPVKILQALSNPVRAANIHTNFATERNPHPDLYR